MSRWTKRDYLRLRPEKNGKKNSEGRRSVNFERANLILNVLLSNECVVVQYYCLPL